jgi:uncharacterized protein (DUF58 family)
MDSFTEEELRRLDGLALGSRATAGGGRTGKHRSPWKGASVEFASHRHYVQGDDPRHLDWRIYGRNERLHIKEFQEETSLRVTLVVDASASMAFGHAGRPAKWDWACRLAAACAYVVHRQQDAVGLVVYDEQPREVRLPAHGTRHFRLLLEALEARRPSGGTRTGTALQALADQLPRRGVVIVLSDLLDDTDPLFAALAHFRRRGNDVLLWQILDPAELDLPFGRVTEWIDMETGEHMEIDADAIRSAYQQALLEAKESCQARCSALRVDFQQVSTATPPVDFLAGFLARRPH